MNNVATYLKDSDSLFRALETKILSILNRHVIRRTFMVPDFEYKRLWRWLLHPLMGTSILKNKKLVFLSVGMTIYASSVMAQPDIPKLCIGQACLGMTIEDLGKIHLENISDKVTIDKVKGSYLSYSYGLDANGKRLWLRGLGFDNSNINKFIQNVKVICSGQLFMAEMKASDREKISILLNPAEIDGKKTFIVRQIKRELPHTMSDSELKNFENMAQDKYGEYYGRYPGMLVKQPAAYISSSFGTRFLSVELPYQNVKLMEQTGCSDKVQLD